MFTICIHAKSFIAMITVVENLKFDKDDRIRHSATGALWEIKQRNRSSADLCGMNMKIMPNYNIYISS